jgi:hypothetical protein
MEPEESLVSFNLLQVEPEFSSVERLFPKKPLPKSTTHSFSAGFLADASR